MKLREMTPNQIIKTSDFNLSFWEYYEVVKTIYCSKRDNCLKIITAFNCGYMLGKASMRNNKG